MKWIVRDAHIGGWPKRYFVICINKGKSYSLIATPGSEADIEWAKREIMKLL